MKEKTRYTMKINIFYNINERTFNDYKCQLKNVQFW